MKKYMNMKTAAIVAAALLMALPASQAEARVFIGVGLGVPVYGAYPAYPAYYPAYPAYYPPPYPYGYAPPPQAYAPPPGYAPQGYGYPAAPQPAPQR